MDQPAEERGEPLQLVRGPVGKGQFDTPVAHLPYALHHREARVRELYELGPAVVRVGDPDDVPDPLQLPQLPGDMGGLHGQPDREHTPGSGRPSRVVQPTVVSSPLQIELA